MLKPKPKGIGVMIAIGKPKDDMPPRPRSLERPDEADSVSSRNHEQESPDDEHKEDSGQVAPTPESVSYHDGSEGCGACEYFEGGHCQFLQMPVDENGWCKRFESKKEDDEPTGEGDVNESDTENYPA